MRIATYTEHGLSRENPRNINIYGNFEIKPDGNIVKQEELLRIGNGFTEAFEEFEQEIRQLYDKKNKNHSRSYEILVSEGFKKKHLFVSDPKESASQRFEIKETVSRNIEFYDQKFDSKNWKELFNQVVTHISKKADIEKSCDDQIGIDVNGFKQEFRRLLSSNYYNDELGHQISFEAVGNSYIDENGLIPEEAKPKPSHSSEYISTQEEFCENIKKLYDKLPENQRQSIAFIPGLSDSNSAMLLKTSKNKNNRPVRKVYHLISNGKVIPQEFYEDINVKDWNNCFMKSFAFVMEELSPELRELATRIKTGEYRESGGTHSDKVRAQDGLFSYKYILSEIDEILRIDSLSKGVQELALGDRNANNNNYVPRPL